MEIKVVGFQEVDYISKKTGDHVEGVSVHYLYNESHTQGNATDTVFVGKGRNNPFEIGKRYNISYNRWGRMDLDNVKLLG